MRRISSLQSVFLSKNLIHIVRSIEGLVRQLRSQRYGKIVVTRPNFEEGKCSDLLTAPNDTTVVFGFPDIPLATPPTLQRSRASTKRAKGIQIASTISRKSRAHGASLVVINYECFYVLLQILLDLVR